MTAWCLTILLSIAPRAHAEEPTATVDGAVVRGSALLASPPSRLIEALRDPAWESAISGSSTRATVTGQSGGCLDVAYVSPNPIFEARYAVRRCPTADGVSATLVSSNAFDTYRTRWRVVPEGTGARVTYEVELTTSLWVPDSMVRSETRRAVAKMMKAIVAWSGG